MAYHVGILPQDVLQTLVTKLNEAESVQNGCQFVRLPHPRTDIPTLFLPYSSSESGKSSILEVQAVAPPNSRSWFLSDEVIGDGKLLLMTPVDPAFLLISLFRRVHSGGNMVGSYRTADDLFEEIAATFSPEEITSLDEAAPSYSTKDIMLLLSFDCAQAALRRICEVKEITSEITVYRYSPEIVNNYLKTKVARLARERVFESSRTLTRNLAKDGLMDDGKEHLLESARIKGACDLVSQYISQDLHATLVASYDLTELNAYMQVARDALSALAAADMAKVEAQESKTKNAANGDKKRKAAKGSFGVEKLKKANVKGMAKISSFFQKPAS